VSLIGSFVLVMYPLRLAVLELLPQDSSVASPRVFGGSTAAAAGPWRHLAVTGALLLSIYFVAVHVPSIWAAITFVGATSATLLVRWQ
jgi:hypothetical protein